MDERKLLGRRIKHLRQLRGLTQEQLAERMDINAKYLSSIERGRENPTLDLFVRLAAALQVDLYELFQFTPGMESPARLQRKIAGLITEIRLEELPKMVRILEALVH
jgi:transcriptional regulator with XRE-family HTH domain